MSDPVTAADIAELLHHLAALRVPARAEDPAARAVFLIRKAELLGRIADQYAHSDPSYSAQVAQPATHARTTARTDTADVNPVLTPAPATTPPPATP